MFALFYNLIQEALEQRDNHMRIVPVGVIDIDAEDAIVDLIAQVVYNLLLTYFSVKAFIRNVNLDEARAEFDYDRHKLGAREIS